MIVMDLSQSSVIRPPSRSPEKPTITNDFFNDIMSGLHNNKILRELDRTHLERLLPSEDQTRLGCRFPTSDRAGS